ncbi:hypothetical protein IW137_001406 [Coemansia sp. RSA 1287]|nr:hypothetical protein IW137_001406 [Coemansia sp. RSA 1287]
MFTSSLAVGVVVSETGVAGIDPLTFSLFIDCAVGIGDGVTVEAATACVDIAGDARGWGVDEAESISTAAPVATAAARASHMCRSSRLSTFHIRPSSRFTVARSHSGCSEVTPLRLRRE